MSETELTRPLSRRDASWSVRNAARLYHVDAWGNDYFFVNDRGRVAVRPTPDAGLSIDLYEVVQHLRARGLRPPLTLRFQDLLKTRVERLHEAFQAAIDGAGYEGVYRGVYPIKVNQLRAVVEEVLEAGRPYRLGLECGSKAELAAALPYLETDRLLICNGGKDRPMMQLMRGAQHLGHGVLPVLERRAEFDLWHRLAREEAGSNGRGVPPFRFGVRVRLSTSGTGLWSESSGEHSKFGLSLSELLALVDALEGSPLPLAFELLHFHLGSQLAGLDSVERAVREATRVYAALRRRGLPLRYLDVGGGLGVPYEAGNAEAQGYVGYTLAAYARTVVEAVKAVCGAESVPQPTLLSESGRALAAYHSVFITEVLGVRSTTAPAPPPASRQDDDAPLLRELSALARRLGAASAPPAPADLQEAYCAAHTLRRQADRHFIEGRLTLAQKARADRLYGRACHLLAARVATLDAEDLPPDLRRLRASRVDRYLCNFSLFRSLPDHWALGQRFPIMPLHRLGEAPSRRGILSDLTCDSDGVVADFVTASGTKSFLELHPLQPGVPYLLGFFLLGAYQDTLGDMHNLFGRPGEALVYADAEAPGGFRIGAVHPGDTVAEQLRAVRYDAAALTERLRAAAAPGRPHAERAERLAGAYTSTLASSTYPASE